MVKWVPFLLVAGVMMTTNGAFAQDERARWGGKELRVASAAALDHFLNLNGEALFATVSGVSLEVNSQGIAAKAKVTFKDETGAKQTASYFCHTHDTEIDCH